MGNIFRDLFRVSLILGFLFMFLGAPLAFANNNTVDERHAADQGSLDGDGPSAPEAKRNNNLRPARSVTRNESSRYSEHSEQYSEHSKTTADLSVGANPPQNAIESRTGSREENSSSAENGAGVKSATGSQRGGTASENTKSSSSSAKE